MSESDPTESRDLAGSRTPGPSDKKVIVFAVGCGVLLLLLLVCSAIAIPAFLNYTKRAKASEAQAQLRRLRMGFQDACRARIQVGGSIGDLRAAPTPPIPGELRQTGDWAADPGFVELGFAPTDSVYYSYSVGPSPVEPANMVLQARGDLDGDGEQSLYEYSCSPTTCDCSAHLFVENELE